MGPEHLGHRPSRARVHQVGGRRVVRGQPRERREPHPRRAVRGGAQGALPAQLVCQGELQPDRVERFEAVPVQVHQGGFAPRHAPPDDTHRCARLAQAVQPRCAVLEQLGVGQHEPSRGIRLVRRASGVGLLLHLASRLRLALPLLLGPRALLTSRATRARLALRASLASRVDLVHPPHGHVPCAPYGEVELERDALLLHSVGQRAQPGYRVLEQPQVHAPG